MLTVIVAIGVHVAQVTDGVEGERDGVDAIWMVAQLSLSEKPLCRTYIRSHSESSRLDSDPRVCAVSDDVLGRMGGATEKGTLQWKGPACQMGTSLTHLENR